MTLTTEARFAGLWRVWREIDDKAGGPPGKFRGLARITPEEGRLRYVEYGALTVGAAKMQATRAYLWRPEGERGVAVAYEDGRPFHRFDWSGVESADEHLCGADLYRVRYVFSAETWRAYWRVEGPEKNYESKSLYVRASTPDAPLAEGGGGA